MSKHLQAIIDYVENPAAVSAQDMTPAEKIGGMWSHAVAGLTPVNALIIAAQKAFEYLGECLNEYNDPDSGPIPNELIDAHHELSQALAGLGRHPYEQEPDRTNTDLPF